jgi:hypothetical protein
MQSAYLGPLTTTLYFSAFKIKQVKIAGLWFRGALACFAVLSVLLMAYAVAGPSRKQSRSRAWAG